MWQGRNSGEGRGFYQEDWPLVKGTGWVSQKGSYSVREEAIPDLGTTLPCSGPKRDHTTPCLGKLIVGIERQTDTVCCGERQGVQSSRAQMHPTGACQGSGVF